jgi:hypothetical protein
MAPALVASASRFALDRRAADRLHSGIRSDAALCCCHEPSGENIVELMASWPAEDQEELSELAREIETRRTGVYRLSDEERAAIDAARRGPLAADDEVEAFWKRRGLA